MTRPFPWKCRECGKRTLKPIVVDYSTEMEHDGRLYSFTVPNLEILECDDCHKRVLPEAALKAITEKFRAEAGLLTPEEIRAYRKTLDLTQEQLATYLRVAKETVSRWETGGQIQQRAMDLLLRLFFSLPQVRWWLGAYKSQEGMVSVGGRIDLNKISKSAERFNKSGLGLSLEEFGGRSNVHVAANKTLDIVARELRPVRSDIVAALARECGLIEMR